MSKVIVIGGGPAGMMAALAAAESGHEVLLLEKNEKIIKIIQFSIQECCKTCCNPFRKEKKEGRG